MGFMDLIKEGVEYVGDKVEKYNKEVNKYYNFYKKAPVEILANKFFEVDGAEKSAIVKILKERGYTRK